MREVDLYYRCRFFSYVPTFIRKHFQLTSNGRYQITITEGGKYKFVKDGHWYNLVEGEFMIGWICRSEFSKLFFTPDYTKTYDIKVKRIPGE